MNKAIEVSIAALLHDIGKLYQRARAPLSTQAERMEQMICPTRDGRATHRHVLWSNDFLENHSSWIPASMDRRFVIDLASRHHRPSEDLDWLITEADRLASGHDRREMSEENIQNFRKIALASIFTTIRLQTTQAARPHFLTPRVLGDPKLDPFPSPDRPEKELDHEHQAIGSRLIAALNDWPTTSPQMLATGLASVSSMYLASTPASTIDEVPDVSLHDHSTLVAAIATALYVWHEENAQLNERAIRDRSSKKFLLLGGDLSGIQSALFDLSSSGQRGVARAFRARSFYFSMLTHAATLRILEEAGLPTFCRVMDAGGRFVLLLPNTNRLRNTLATASAEIDRFMVDEFGGRLTLNLAEPVEASGGDFLSDGFPALLSRLQATIEQSKRRKLGHLLQSNHRWVQGQQVLPYVHTKQHCERRTELDRALGAELPKAIYVGIWKDAAPVGLLDKPRRILSFEMQLFRSLPRQADIQGAVDFFALQSGSTAGDDHPPAWIPVRSNSNHVPRLNKLDEQQLAASAQPDLADSMQGDDSPAAAGATATFEHLALLAQSPSRRKPGRHVGIAAIACLKADVDRLGMLFSSGFGTNHSFGRVATLSREMDRFFKDFLPRQFSSETGPYRLVYSVFSGGDDLVLIGPWHVMVDLARDLRNWFSRFTGANPDVTLSAGIAIGGPRRPVSALVGSAEQELEAAKERPDPLTRRTRNRVGIFGDVFEWPHFEQALDVGTRLHRMLDSPDQGAGLQLNTAFVYRLLQYAKAAIKIQAGSIGQAATGAPGAVHLADVQSQLTWRSHLVYDLHRNIEKGKSHSPEAKQDLEWLRQFLVHELRASADSARVLKLAAMYALYRTRGG